MSDEQKSQEIKPNAQAVAPRQWTIGLREGAMAFQPRTWQEIFDFANLVCKTDFVPADFRDKPGSVLAAWQTGHEVGLPPMASVKYIAVINGRTRIWGNAYWALVNAHPLCEWTEELPEHEALAKGYGECTVKRKGRKNPIIARFTKEMAEQSGVWGGKGSTTEKREQSVWFKRPGRMLQWMARNLAGNDAIPEATLGLEIAELAEDEPRDVTPLKTPQELPEEKPKNEKRAESSPASPKGDQQTTPSKPPKKADKSAETAPPVQEEKSQEDLINELILWVESCPEEQLFQDNSDNYLFQELKKIKGTANQLKVLKPFNDRRQALAKAPSDT